MSKIIRIKNASGVDADWVGQTILNNGTFDIPVGQLSSWQSNAQVFTDVGNGNIIVSDGVSEFNSVKGWSWILGDTLPMSDLGDKLYVHSSSKPVRDGKFYHLVWTGAGDDVTNHIIAGGDLVQFSLTPSSGEVAIDVEFDPSFGDVFIHEGYAKWEGGGMGDYLSADIITPPSALQPSVNLDLEIVDNWIIPAAGGAGTGTHGWAATPYLIPRTFSADGEWDYDEDTSTLSINATNTGGYKISDIERGIHRYINKIPVNGTSYGYNPLTSEETAYLPPGYFIRVRVNNVSNSTWTLSIFMELYRERTNVP